MKKYKNIYPQISSFDNLYQAAIQARKGKKETPQNIHFHFSLEKQLLLLEKQLHQKTYVPGSYKTFTIYDPKMRRISAAPYRDRVVHHALCRVIEPLFDRTFIFDSYANRVGKGSHKAIARFQFYARKFPYVLKCDIRKFFPSLDHEVLKQELRWKIACPDTLWLIDTIIDHSNKQEEHLVKFPQDIDGTYIARRRGLPIGNLTSQFWANVYMNRFDHYLKEELQVPGYIRYVDDFVLFAPSKGALRAFQTLIGEYLASIRLLLHPEKTHIFQVQKGVPFLGFQVFPYHRYVLKAKRRRYRRHLRNKLKQPELYPHTKIIEGLNSWLGHIGFGQSKRLKAQTFSYLVERGVKLYQRPGGSWGLLEQQSK